MVSMKTPAPIKYLVPLLTGILLLAGCSNVQPPLRGPSDSAPLPINEPGDGPPLTQIDINTIPDAVPQPEPYSKYGNPASYVVFGKTYVPLKSSKGHVERGISSWYGTKFHGRRTSSGEPYNIYDMTAAHKTLPLPTYARVTNLDNGRSVIVKINDRGPFHDDRILDLSYVAAMKLDIVKNGTGRIELRVIDTGTTTTAPIQAANATPATVTAPPATPQNTFLQVGAFSTFSNADTLRNRLSSIASSPVVISKSDQPQPLYRVRIGPLSGDQEAQALAQQLSSMGLTQTSVVLD